MDIFSIDLDFVNLAFDEKKQCWTMGYNLYFSVGNTSDRQSYYDCSFNVIINSKGQVKDIIVLTKEKRDFFSECINQSGAVQEQIWASQETIKTVEAFKRSDWREHFDHSRSNLNSLPIKLFLNHQLFSMKVYTTSIGDIDSILFYLEMDPTKKRYSTAYLFDGFDDFLGQEKINDIQNYIKEKNRIRYLMKK